MLNHLVNVRGFVLNVNIGVMVVYIPSNTCDAEILANVAGTSSPSRATKFSVIPDIPLSGYGSFTK